MNCNMEQVFNDDITYKTNSQLMAKCEYDPSTGKTSYVNFEKYYGSVIL